MLFSPTKVAQHPIMHEIFPLENFAVDEEKAAEFLDDTGGDIENSDTNELDAQIPRVAASWSCLFAFFHNSNSLYPLLAACVTTVVSGLIVPAVSVVLGNIFNLLSQFSLGAFNGEKLLLQVVGNIWILIWLGIICFVSNGLFIAFWQLFAESQAKRAREAVFEGMLGQELEWYDRQRNGVAAMLSASQTHIGELETALGQPSGLVLQSLVTSVACIVIAFLHSQNITLVILSGLPIAGYIQYYLHSKLPALVHAQKQHLANASKAASRTISNIQTVKCLNGEVYELGIFSSAVRRAAGAYRLQVQNEALKMGIFQFATLAMFVGGFWYGGVLMLNKSSRNNDILSNENDTKAGDTMTATWSCLMAVQHFQMIVPHLSTLEIGKIAGARLRFMMSMVQRDFQEHFYNKMELGVEPAEFCGDIRFEDVSFVYPSRPSQLALKGLTMSIVSNTTTWIVGRSGSGKSTIGNLILKAYIPKTGVVTLDGNPIESLNTEWLRKNITLVQQNSVLFDDTLFQNIALGKDGFTTTRQQATEALAMAGGEDILTDSGGGWGRLVGSRGRNLSDGQRQRVVLARAILRNTPFLILDEAVSALDRPTRIQVMNSISKWRRDRTTVIITHDISQIPFDDMVYFVEDGVVVESGLRSGLEGKEGGYFENFFLASLKESLLSGQETLGESGLDYDTEFFSGRQRKRSTIGFSSGVDAGLSDKSSAEEKRYQHPHRRKMPVWPPDVQNYRIDDPANTDIMTPIKSSFPTTWPLHSHTPLKKKQTTKHLTLKEILYTIWPSLGARCRLSLIIGIITALLHALATPLFSFSLSKVLSSYCSPSVEESEFKKNALRVLWIALFDGFTTYAMRYCLESVGQEWVDTQRSEAYRRIIKQPLEWFENPMNGVSEIPENLEKHAEVMKALVSSFSGYILVGVVMILTAAIWALILCWQFTLCVVVILVILIPIIGFFQKAADSCEEKCNSAAVKTGEILRETVENIATVKVLQLQRYFGRKYHDAVGKTFKAGLKRCGWAGVAFAMTESFMLWALAFILYYGTYLVSKQSYDLQPVIAVLTLLTLSLSQGTSTLAMIPQLSTCKDTSRRLLRLSSLPETSHESSGALRPSSIQGTLTITNLTFSYHPHSPPTLHNLNLSIPAHNPPLIISGSSGSGKSTLLKLLLRLYPIPTTIHLDNTPLTSIDTKYLREIISFVPASPSLFDGLTILENITYGSGIISTTSSPELELVYTAAQLAGIHEFIMALPNGYDTVLNRGGAGAGGGCCSLSGGQAQRIAIARAVVRRPKVLLLDEPSAGLDVLSERVLGRELQKVAGEEDVTVVIVTHGNVCGSGNGREDADDDKNRDSERVGMSGNGRIGRHVVFENGRVVEEF